MDQNELSSSIADKMNGIKSGITELDELLGKIVQSGPEAKDACSILAELNFLKRDLSVVYDSYSYAVASIMGSIENIKLEDGSEIEKKSSYDRKGWDHKSLGSAVADKLVKMSIDMDTGEILKTPREIAVELLTYCAPSYWRIKELNKLGINADNYCEVGDLKTSIIVRKPKS